MLVLELFLNGSHVATAGAEDLSVIGAHVSAVGRLGAKSSGAAVQRNGVAITCDLGGMTSDGSHSGMMHLLWKQLSLAVGDEVCIRILESNTADPPLTQGAPNAK
jgi:hypothetical protein